MNDWLLLYKFFHLGFIYPDEKYPCWLYATLPGADKPIPEPALIKALFCFVYSGMSSNFKQ